MEPESTRVEKGGMSYSLVVMRGWSELGSERADVLRRASLTAQSGSMQLPACVERELPSIFLPPSRPSVWLPTFLLLRREPWQHARST